jgi:ketosteroid isomerase-like protein
MVRASFSRSNTWMTERDLETLQRYLTAWGSGDVVAVLGLYHQDLELQWPGSHRLAGVHAGRDASIAALLELQSVTQRVLHDVRSISADGAFADVELVERWTIDGEVFDVPRLLRFGIRNDRIASCTVTERVPDRVDRALGSIGSPVDLDGVDQSARSSTTGA